MRRVLLGSFVILLVGACTLISPPEDEPTIPAVTGEAPPDILTPNVLQTPISSDTTPPPDVVRACSVTTDDLLALRVADNIQAAEAAILGINTTSRVIGRNRDNTWWRVESPMGVRGWVDASAVTVSGDCSQIPVNISGTPTPAPTTTPAIPAANIKVNLNVRSGPSVRFAPPIGQLGVGDTVDLLAVNSAGGWYKIDYRGREGWIAGAAEYVDLAGNLTRLPVEAGPPTPTPSNTPIPSTPTPTLDPSINYLRDPSFEGQYVSRGYPDLNSPVDWQLVYFEEPRNYEWQNLRPVAFPHVNPPEIRSGERSQNLNRDYATFTAVIYQQVTVPANITVSASAWAWIHTCDPQPAICNSDPNSGATVRVGVDPAGGSDPNADRVVWSEPISPHDSWGNVGVRTQAQGSTVTVFLWGSQPEPRGLNRLYWDDAALNVGG